MSTAEAQAWKWLQGLGKNAVIHCYQHSYAIPSSHPSKMNANVWLQQYTTMSWQIFDELSSWLYSGQLVTIPMMCSCKTNLKSYVCKHALGMMIHLGYYFVQDPSKLENFSKKRGRPKKTRLALIK
ncbi:unnamed protein product [Didymodactylos carnosus]|uniref:SWIM-type domain-containing protein n=1 Tax=Didymodactylos carnosus TaxID=1234261 RepID=A0A8S2NJN1_9BILA|nr:unnamed protein product [Didymodactylos carnosus]CAF4005192.1 unnamed protein product [Didymodactylos carnosus]